MADRIVCGQIVSALNGFLTIIEEKSQEKLRIRCNYFCPARKGDLICVRVKDSVASKQPFVMIPIDSSNVIENIQRALHCGEKKAKGVYNALSNIEKNAVSVLDNLAKVFEMRQSVEKITIASLSEDEIKTLLRWWWNSRLLRKLYLLGLTKREIRLSYLTVDDLYERLCKNPYTIASVPMEKCNNIMSALGEQPVQLDISCGEYLRFLTDKREKRSWTCTPIEYLLKFQKLSKHLDYFKQEFGVTFEFQCGYTSIAKDVETRVAEYISGRIDESIKIEEDAEFSLLTISEEQKKAVNAALSLPICIITSLAGGGKSSCIGQIVYNLKKRNIRYAIVSFTGKSISRITQILRQQGLITSESDIHPHTMHKLLHRYKSGEAVTQFDHLIIDETSMVTTELFDKFVRTFDCKKITFVGDVNQLTPIGWGSLFSELCKCEFVPKYILTKNFRLYLRDSNETDYVHLNSQLILKNKGDCVEFENGHNFTIVAGDEELVVSIVKALVDSGCDGKYKVLSPYNLTVESINRKIQAKLNEENLQNEEKSVIYEDIAWCIGDQVMMRVNNYDIGVFNGEEGVVTGIIHRGNTEDQKYPILEIEFENGKFELSVKSEKEREDDEDEIKVGTPIISHSFAITVDKSQGSEWDYIIFFVPTGSDNSFVHRNRIYTAITRAKCAVWLVGDITTLQNGAASYPPLRYDHLCDRITDIAVKKLE